MNSKLITSRLKTLFLSWVALWNYSFGNKDSAIARLKKCIELDPENGPNLQTLGSILVKSGRYGDGLSYLESALEHLSIKNKSRPEIFAYIAYAQFSMGRSYESLENYQQAIDNWIKDGDFKKSELLYNLGRIYLQKNDISKAQSAFLQGLKLDEKDSNIHFGLGISYYEQDNKEESLYHLERAIELDPSLRNDSTLNKIKKEVEKYISIH